MLNHSEISEILSQFGLTFRTVNNFYDTSHGEDDQRLNYILDERYVLKLASSSSITDDRLLEINRLIARYRTIGVYCPSYIPAKDGRLSVPYRKDTQKYTCFVEEYAIYPVCEMDFDIDRKEVVEHLGILAAKYSGIDLSEAKSMWSIIDLAPLDEDIDEKQENTNALAEALRENGQGELAQQVEAFNELLRKHILSVFPNLPRCVFQGDLNDTNLLYNGNQFAGLIDFNLSGTDVNINVFLNETAHFPEENEFASQPIQVLLAQMDAEQEVLLSVIFRHYNLNAEEAYALPYYKRLIDLFQYPNVCKMVKWLSSELHRDKCVALIRAMLSLPLKDEKL